jgi:hypothetical protein
MSENIKIEKIISSMYLDVVHGDIHIRSLYMSTMLSHVEAFMMQTKVKSILPATVRFRTRLHNAVFYILQNNHPLPVIMPEREDEIRKYQMYFDKYVFKIDTQHPTEDDIEQIQLLEDIEAINYCRNVCYSAAADYSDSLSERPEGLTNASNKYSLVLNIMIPILYRNKIIDITETEFTNAAAAGLKKIENAKLRDVQK